MFASVFCNIVSPTYTYLPTGVTALIGGPCRTRGYWGIARDKWTLNRTLEIGHTGSSCTQSQGSELDEDLS